MDSTARFLLGGALGAALGYLLSQKNLERAIQSGQLSAPVPAPTAAQGTYTGSPPAASPAVSPVAAAVAAPTTLAPESRAGIGTVPALPGREWTIPPAPPAPVPEKTLPGFEAPESAESSDSEVIITRDFLEEPIPGSGWRSSAPPAPVETRGYTARTAASTELAADEALADRPAVEQAVELPVEEELVEPPVVEQRFVDVAAPGSPGVVLPSGMTTTPQERVSFGETKPVDGPSRVDDLKSRIEETRRRIRHELEQPFDIAVTTRMPERDWTGLGGAPPVVGETLVLEPTADSVAAEPSTAEPFVVPPETVALESMMSVPTAMEEMPVEEVVVEPIPLETVAVDEVVFETAAVEPVVIEPLVVEPAPAEVESAPTAVAEPVAVEPIAESPLAAELVTVEAMAMESAIGAPAADGALETQVVTDSVAVTAEAADGGAEVGLELDQPVDYDSMKDRIETTRSRLKAKAFDAMMTGESALLGRDIGGTQRSQAKVPGVDSDIDQTIETNLREEEE